MTSPSCKLSSVPASLEALESILKECHEQEDRASVVEAARQLTAKIAAIPNGKVKLAWEEDGRYCLVVIHKGFLPMVLRCLIPDEVQGYPVYLDEVLGKTG